MRILVAAFVFGTLAGPGAALAQDAAAGDVAEGAKVYTQCRACHQIGPTAKNAVGPVHNGLIGRKAGTYPGYNYSAANKNSGLTWDEATLRDYLHDPKAKIPGTKMVFPGIKDDKKITDLIAFIKQYDAQGNIVPAK